MKSIFDQLRVISCECINYCRDWRETRGPGGLRLPPSDHSPACSKYKLEKFVRVVHDGSSFVCTSKEAELFWESCDKIEEYVFKKIEMTQDQYEKLDEFKGF